MSFVGLLLQTTESLFGALESMRDAVYNELVVCGRCETMEYMSTADAAKKWNVSARNVQRLLTEKRIPGATKMGGVWLIPTQANKPVDPRKARKQAEEKRAAYIFSTTVPLPKSDADAGVNKLSEPYRALAAADVAYRRGNPEPAKECWRNTCLDSVSKLSAASLATAAAISSGDYALYDEIASFLKSRIARAKSEEEWALFCLPGTMATVSMAARDMTPGWLINCDFSLFPAEITPFLLYLHAMYLRVIGDFQGLLSVARTAYLLCRKADTFTWLDIYLLLLSAIALYNMGNEASAEAYLVKALDLGIPNGLIMPFADYLGGFGGLLEKLIARKYPEQLAPITALWNVSFKNWMLFHNRFTKENITTILTAQEYQVARHISHGATYAETARRMSVSIGRINNIVLEIYSKLYIRKKNQLNDFLL